MNSTEQPMKDKVAIITGGASGIGEAVGKTFAANGCKVMLVDFNGDRLDQVVADISAVGGVCSTTIIFPGQRQL